MTRSKIRPVLLAKLDHTGPEAKSMVACRRDNALVFILKTGCLQKVKGFGNGTKYYSPRPFGEAGPHQSRSEVNGCLKKG